MTFPETAEQVDDTPIDVDAVLTDDATRQLSEAQSQESTPAPVDTPGAGQEGGTAVDQPQPKHPAGDDAPPTIQQREDGKYQLGNFVGESPEAVAQEVFKAQREAQAELTRRQQQDNRLDDLSLAAEQGDDEELIDDETWSAFEAWQAQNAQAEQQQRPLTPLEYAQAIQTIDRFVRDPNATKETFRAAATMALQIGDGGKLDQVLETWGQVDPYSAIGFKNELMMAQQQAIAEQQQAVEHQQSQESTQVLEVKKAAHATAEQAYYAQNPDWQHIDGAVRQVLEQSSWMLEAAMNQAVQQKSAAPLLQVYNQAAVVARQMLQQQGVQQPVAQPQAFATAPAGQQPGMVPQQPQPAAQPQYVVGPHGQWYAQPPTEAQMMQQQQAAITQQKVDAQVGTGSASDIDVKTQVSNPQGHAQQDIAEIVGLMGKVER